MVKFLKKVKRFFSEHHYLCYLIVFIIAFVYFFILQYHTTFSDPDSFYHTKLSLLIRDQGVFQEFPWLQFTILKDSFADQHFLYHVFLIPFVSLLQPVMGAKIATIILESGLITLIYWFLYRMKVKFALLFGLFPLLINPFIFRISLVKAPSFSLIVLILGLYLIFRQRPKLLFALAFFYVWSYGGFALLLVFTLLFWFIQSLFDLITAYKKSRDGFKRIRFQAHLKHIFRSFFSKKKIMLIGSVFGGLIAGIIINPYFPKNLTYYWYQLIQIGIINYRDIIGVGGEWYPYGFVNLMSNSVLLSILLIVALIIFFLFIKKQNPRSVTLFIITAFFFVLTLKSRRYVEYYIPFAVIFCALSLNVVLVKVKLRQALRGFVKFYLQRKVLVTALIVYFAVAIPSIAIRDYTINYRDLHSGIDYQKFSQSSTWLRENTPAGSIVLHSDWDEFPILFYHNSHNYYIVGLDPTFMYQYNEDLYWKWVNITIGKQRDDLYNIIKNDFGASYVFLEKDHVVMDRNIDNDEGFEEVYEDEEAKIYQIN